MTRIEMKHCNMILQSKAATISTLSSGKIDEDKFLM